jgi:Zn-dependent protease/CBS domain-containing protein
MGRSFTIARISGIAVRIHVTFFLLLIWIGLAHYWIGGPEAALRGVAFILAIFGCVLLHEFGHAFAARMYGIPTPDITLLPIGGVARLQRMPDKPAQEIVVALAGPAVNVVIAAALFAVIGDAFDLSNVLRINDPRHAFLSQVAVVNVWLVLFNLLPAFPMDGGRVLRAGLAMFMRYSAATQIAARTGQAMAFLFGLAGLFINPFLILIALFVYLAASQEAAYAQIKDVMEDLLVRDAMITEFITLDAGAVIDDAIEAVLRTRQREFPVVTADGRLVGMLTRDHIVASYRRNGPLTPVAEVMHREAPVIGSHEPLHAALQAMQGSGSPAVAVTDRSGRMTGLVSLEMVGELMAIHATPARRAATRMRFGR